MAKVPVPMQTVALKPADDDFSDPQTIDRWNIHSLVLAPVSVEKGWLKLADGDASDYAKAAEAISLIKGTDSIARCRNTARRIAEEAKHHLDPLPDSEYKSAMCQLVDFFVSRDR